MEEAFTGDCSTAELLRNVVNFLCPHAYGQSENYNRSLFDYRRPPYRSCPLIGSFLALTRKALNESCAPMTIGAHSTARHAYFSAEKLRDPSLQEQYTFWPFQKMAQKVLRCFQLSHLNLAPLRDSGLAA